MTRLAAEAVGWAVEGRFVLVDVALALPAGSLNVLTGENGAGKSTLLDILAGARKPARGHVALDGVPLAEIAPAHLARRIARLDHTPGLYLELSALENLQLFHGLVQSPGAPLDAAALLERVGLAARDQRRPVRGFSRGMLQRTALARVLASGADVWLLDEPSTGLDRAGCALLADVLADVRARGATVLLATHDPALLPLADARLHLSHGRLVAAEVA